MLIRRYTGADRASLFEMFREEGEDWSDYYGEAGYPRYVKALESSIAYVACDGGMLIGYIRCREDDGFGVYVYDLLVQKHQRGRQIGKMLMERVCEDFEGQPVYVMSDVDPYYEKLGYKKEGSIFIVTKHD